jgi:hypothetical protein
MTDEDTEVVVAPATDAAAGMATALIALTTVMLLIATITALKILGDHYHEGLLKP